MRHEQVLVVCLLVLFWLLGAGVAVGQEMAAPPADITAPDAPRVSLSPAAYLPDLPLPAASPPVTDTRALPNLAGLGTLTLAQGRPATTAAPVPGVEQAGRLSSPRSAPHPAQPPTVQVPASVVTVDTTSSVWDGNTASIPDLIANPGPDGKISFREALEAVNNSGAGHTIAFNLPSGSTITKPAGSGTWFLTAANTTIDGDTNADGKPDVGIIPEETIVALEVRSDHNLIRNLAIEGLRLWGETGEYNTVTGCYVGTNVAGRLSLGLESTGIEIQEGAHHNTVENCIIAGNAGSDPDWPSFGISIWAGAHDNTVRNNRIGVNVDGVALPNETGVSIGNAPGTSGGEPFGNVSGNLIGGSHSAGVCDGACNTISGNNRFGVLVYGSEAVTNTVAGNFIGLATSGSGALANSLSGVLLQHGARNNVIGGQRPAAFVCGGECNAIGANNEAGVGLAEAGTTGNRVQGNNIGLGPDGHLEMANGFSGVYLWQGVSGNLIGGRPAGEQYTGPSNLIGHNAEAGVLLRSAGTVTNTVEGNAIESNAQGGVIAFEGASENRIGAERAAGPCSGPCNLIRDNGFFGVGVDGVLTRHNAIRGNEYDANQGRAIELLPWGGIGVDVIGGNDGRVAPALFPLEADGTQRGAVDAPDGSVVELYTADGALLGSATVSGKQFSAELGTGVGAPVVATITDPAGNTSEFSLRGELTLVAPYAVPGSRVYAFGLLTATMPVSVMHTAGPAVVAAGTQTFTLFNRGTAADFKAGDVYYSGWITAPATAGDYPVTLSISRTGSVAATLHVVEEPSLVVLTDLEALHNEFKLTDNVNRPEFYPELYGSLKQLAAYAGRHTGFLADLKREIAGYRAYAYGSDNVADTAVRCAMGTAIDNYIATLQPYAGTLRYLAIIGDDAVVPYFRRHDPLYDPANCAVPGSNAVGSTECAERDYPTNSEMGLPQGNATLFDSGRSKIMTDVPYGSFDATNPDNVPQPTTDLGVGRIFYPTPEALAQALNRYETPLTLDETAIAGGLHIAPEPNLAWENVFEMAIVPPVEDVFDTTVLMAQLTIPPPAQSGTFYRFNGRLLNWTPASVSDVLSNAHLGVIYSHADHQHSTVPSGPPGFTGADLGALPDRTGRLVVNTGCHSGYSISRQAAVGAPDRYNSGLVNNALVKHLAWLAPTTYGLGSNSSLQYHDQFFKLFLESALDSAPTVGQALRDAGQRYEHETCSLIVLCSNAWDDTDTYTRYGTAYYGLPTQPIGDREAKAMEWLPRAGSEQAGAQASYVLNVTVDTPNFRRVTNPGGTTRFELPNTGALGGTAHYPLLPQVTRLYRLPAGANVTNVQLVDQASSVYPDPVTPETLVPVNRTFGPRPGAEPLTAPFPANLYWTSTTPLDGGVLLTVIVNPMRYDPATQRATLYSHLALRVTYDAPAPGLSVTGLLVNGGAPVTAGQASLPLRATIQSPGAQTAVLSWWMIDAAGSQVAAGREDVTLVAGTNTVDWTGDTLGWHPGPVQLLAALGDGAQVLAGGETTFVVQGRSLEADTGLLYYNNQPAAVLKVGVFDQAGAGVTGLAGSLGATLDGAPLALAWTRGQPGEYEAQVPLAGVAEGRHMVQVQAPGAPPAVTGLAVDRTPPVATVDPLPAQTGALTIPVSLSGEDEVAGVAYYELQYTMDGLDYWVDWMTHTAYLDYYPGGSSVWFGPAQVGRTYSFRARAVDQAGNWSGYPPGAGQAQTKVVVPNYAQQVVDLSNVERGRYGFPALRVQKELTVAADWFAGDMAAYGYMNDDHTDRLGRTADERILAFGYGPRSVTRENMALGYAVPGWAVTAWMESPGHRANLLSSDVREIGAGYAFNAADPSGHYWVQDFGTRTGVYPVVINEDAAFAFSSTARLYVYGQGWAEQMRVSNDSAAWTAWEPYHAERTWTLAPGLGARTVYVQLRRGNEILYTQDDIEVVSLAAGAPGNVWAWGRNDNGQLGTGDPDLDLSLVPTRTAVLADVRAVAAGGMHSLAVRNDGSVWAWGDNSQGQVGDGTTTDRRAPVQVPGLSGVLAVSASTYHSLAVRSDGTVWAWGQNLYGQLGDGTGIDRHSPVQVPGLTGVVAVSAGAMHSLALETDGSVWAWGDNNHGQLGDGSTTRRLSPVRSVGLSGITAVAAGSEFSLALDGYGQVWSWGGNLNGSLGNGTQNDSPWPDAIPDLSHIVAVSAGLLHGLALQDNGTVWAWGYNQEGQLGRYTDLQCWCSPSLGCYTCSLTPLAVVGGATAIAAGRAHSLALAVGGSLLAWGSNAGGQLGDGTGRPRLYPVAVPGLGGITAVAAGDHSLAISPWDATRTPPASTQPLPTAPPQPPPTLVSDQPWLVKDINPALDPAAGSSPTVLTPAGSRLYFSAVRDAEGRELWLSDGTEAGTHLVNDVRPGPAGSEPRTPVWANNLLFSSIHDGSSGRELWRSDGTPAGTFLLRDIFCYDPEQNEFALNRRGPEWLTAVGSTLFFAANDSCYDDQWSETLANWELWKSDGTPEGTVQVAEIAKPTGGYYNSSSPKKLTNVGGTLFFVARDWDWSDAHQTYISHGRELWKSDGTEDGTVMVKDILAGNQGSDAEYLTGMGATLYFSAKDEANGRELWKSDGTAAGTVLVKDLIPGPEPYYTGPEDLTAVGSSLFFKASDGTSGTELWKSDGTAAGTLMVKDITAGSGSSSLSAMTNVNGTLFFAAGGTGGARLWKSDGTAGGTVEVKGPFPNPPACPVAMGGKLYFVAAADAAFPRLWVSDGTAAGTTVVKDVPIYMADAQNGPCLVNWGGTLYFQSSGDGALGAELWKSDGTAAGTVPVGDLHPGPQGAARSADAPLVAGNGPLLLAASDHMTDTELWVSDGTEAGTVRLKDANPGPAGSNPAALTTFDRITYFSADDGEFGRELWRTCSTPDSTGQLRNLGFGEVGSDPDEFTRAGGVTFFVAADLGHGRELWKTDDSWPGTVLVRDIWPGMDSSYPRSLVVLNGSLYFFASSSQAEPCAMWKSDGTTAGTVQVKGWSGGCATDIQPVVWNGLIYFIMQGGLWASDGSTAGTQLRVEMNDGELDALAAIPSRLFLHTLTMPYSGASSELWASDGTQAGTVELTTCSKPGAMLPLGNRLLYVGRQWDGWWPYQKGWELCVSDGTPEGTVLVKDINPGAAGSLPHDLTRLSDRLAVLAASDGLNGVEIWKTDGTPAGTKRLTDVAPGPRSANPHGFVVVGPALFFWADDGVHGEELWAMPVPGGTEWQARCYLPLVMRDYRAP